MKILTFFRKIYHCLVEKIEGGGPSGIRPFVKILKADICCAIHEDGDSIRTAFTRPKIQHRYGEHLEFIISGYTLKLAGGAGVSKEDALSSFIHLFKGEEYIDISGEEATELFTILMRHMPRVQRELEKAKLLNDYSIFNSKPTAEPKEVKPKTTEIEFPIIGNMYKYDRFEIKVITVANFPDMGYMVCAEIKLDHDNFKDVRMTLEDFWEKNR
tara:strand:- start:747 stop:1388 length:642 start_codon:yes stop_codon:yes gene_type:complete